MVKQDGKLKELLDEVAKADGWEVTYRGGHWKITNPRGRSAFAPTTTGDRKAWYQVRLKLRRLGWDK